MIENTRLTRRRIGLLVITAVAVLGVVASPYRTDIRNLFTVGFFNTALTLAVPITLAGVGGLYSEKSGVINIGIEGLLIAAAFTSVLVTGTTVSTVGADNAVWLGLLAAVVVSTLGALLFGVICIRYKADQIIAGLAIWFVFLGLAPFFSRVYWGQINSPTVATFDQIAIPVLSEIPWLGTLLFTNYPTTYLMLIIVPVAWYVLKFTSFGMWVRASGEHPEALDTAGISVNRVRYASIMISGALSGIGGAAMTLSTVGQFIGQGQTIVNGRGFIGIVAYLMGNYNPIGTFGAAALFAGLDALQVRLQQIGFDIAPELFGAIPYIAVIVVLVFFGYTRIPDRAGENYESGDD
ncbi:ABC transporter permease [Halostella sp. PRR32]|uniref:ABC transporter permease n=1 Tax=Halostella sp. PRR32 TaxID=3098147 RepID=UPI002B1DF274|nr:ABC transporter permease [Halostella sp. PRR32]